MAIAPTPITAPDPTAALPALDFGDAFAQALKDDNAPMQVPDPAPAPAPAPAPDPAAAAAGGDPGATSATGDEKTVDELAASAAAANGEGGVADGEGGEPAKPAPAPAPAPEPDSVERLATLLGDRLKQPEPTPTPAPTETIPQAEDFYTEEEKGIIAAYEKEWPDVARVEKIRRKGEYNMLVTHVFREFAKEMQPVGQLLSQLLARQQYQDLTTLVPEYDAESDKVAEWVDGLPQGLLKNAYSAAITQGSADDIQQLFAAYRTATGATAPAPAGITKPVAKPVTELPARTIQAVAALAPVSTKRSAQPAASPETFDDAFAVYAKTPD